MSEDAASPEFHIGQKDQSEEAELLSLGGLYERAKNWFGALIWEADRTKDEAKRSFLEITAAVLFLAVAFLFVNFDFKKIDILAQADETPIVATEGSQPERGPPTFDFGDDISQDERDQIGDATKVGCEILVSESGIQLGSFQVHAYSTTQSLIDVYMTRFNIDLQKRQEIEVRLAAATAFTEGHSDLFINTRSPGWNQHSPLADGLVLPGRYWTILHECFHLAQSKVKADRAPQFPMWLYESSAHYFAGRAMADNKLYDWDKIRQGQVAKAATVGEDLRSMETAVGFFGAGEPYADEYSLGFLAVEKLTADWPNGEIDRLMKFWSAVGSGGDWREAFADTFGKRLEVFYADFELYRARGFK